MTFNVNKTADFPDADPGDGVCDYDLGTPGNQCSLRAAIQESAYKGNHVINVPPGTYSLTISGDDEVSKVGDLDIYGFSGSVTITGTGASPASVIIQAQGSNDRILDIHQKDVTITGVTIRNGATGGAGGGIRVNSTGTLVLKNSVVENNVSGNHGGGIYNANTVTLNNVTVQNNQVTGENYTGGGIYNAGTLGLDEVVVLNNTSADGNGGGIANARDATLTGTAVRVEGNSALLRLGSSPKDIHGGGIQTHGNISLSSSEIINNDSDGDGGGITCRTDGSLTFRGVTIEGNVSGAGGGGIAILGDGQAAITSCIISNNSAPASSGGGIYNNGSVAIDSTTIRGNQALLGAGIANGFGSVIMTLTRSTVRDNQTSTRFLSGAGIWNAGSDLRIINSTISQNSADNGLGIGSGIVNQFDGTCRISHVTIADNTASSGGGVYNDGTFILRNTILDNNTGGNWTGSVAMQSKDYNIDSDGSCGLGNTNDQSNIDPNLKPLTDNGGPTATHALRPASPAIDAGTCVDLWASQVIEDQRGEPRPEDGDGDGSAECDIGAYEAPRAGQEFYVLLIDRTGSMSVPLTNTPPGSNANNRFERALELANEDVNSIFASDPAAQVAVMSFSTSPGNPGDPGIKVELDFTNTQQDVIDAINNMPGPGGATPLARAMSDAVDLLILAAGPDFRHLYVYTDGYENASVHNTASPVVGDGAAACDQDLVPDPSAPIWPDNWIQTCDPTDLVNFPCSGYQQCMAQAFIDHGTVNVRYFGEVTTKAGRYRDVELEDQPSSTNSKIADGDVISSMQTSVQALSGDFAFLKAIADSSGGFFSFERDDPSTYVCIDTTRTLNGRTVEVPISRFGAPLLTGGFDLLISYDPSLLSFLQATRGALLDSLEWEYFTYRTGAGGNCPGGCPDGLVRLVAIADLDNGPGNHPIVSAAAGVLANLEFQVSGDRNLIGQCAPIQFYWNDCGDNTFASISGDTTYVDLQILNATGNFLWDEEDDDQFPDDARPQGLGAPDVCLQGSGPDKPNPIRRIIFCNGWVCIDEPPDDRGDINLNGLANEVADAVLFSSYFVYGNSVWDPIFMESQILATDVNNDGLVLTVADLVYLIRIITGDEQPFPKLSPQQLTASVKWQIKDGDLVVDWNSQADAGAVLLAFDHKGAQFGEPVLSGNAAGMKFISHDDGSQLRVLIYGMEKGTRIASGDGVLLTVPVIERGDGLSLAEVDAADYWGNPINVDRAKAGTVPREFALLQNIPNPFNASTRISFMLPDAGDVKLTVYDVLGRTVATLVDGYLEPGEHHIIWDARDDRGGTLASGVYVYRIVTTRQQASRKMVLLK